MTEFEAAITDWENRVEDDLLAVARQSCQTLAFRVLTDTNVDTGYLRGSWQPAIGEMAAAIDADKVSLDPGGGLGQAALAVVIANLKLGETFYYTNNCVYAMRIEYGFVGEDSLGRYYNQAGHYFTTNNVAQWGSIVTQTVETLI